MAWTFDPAKIDHQKLAIIKKSTFFIRSSWNLVKIIISHELSILTKFHEDWIKNVDFLLMANFCESPIFFYSLFMYDSGL